MALESAFYINQLNSANPASSDSLKEADDHIRLIKSVLQNTFPNLTSPVTANASELSSVFPIGGIIMWSGSLATIPTGWALCAGQTLIRTDGAGTIVAPNLVNRFIVGAGDGLNTGANPSKYAVGATGGSDTVTLTTAQLAAHTHTLTVTGTAESAGAHTHTITDPGHLHTYIGKSVTGGDNTGGDPQNLTNQTKNTSTATTGITINSAGAHTHALTVSGTAANAGGGEAHENRPPYYALAYIMKY